MGEGERVGPKKRVGPGFRAARKEKERGKGWACWAESKERKKK